MNRIILENLYIKLEFIVSDDKFIRLNYLGDKNGNFIKGDSGISSFVEVECSETDHMGSHTQKFLKSPYGTNAKFKSYEKIKKENGQQLNIVTESDLLEVTTHILLFDNCASYNIYNTVKNISSGNLTLERVSSSYLVGFGSDTIHAFSDMYIHFATNSWHSESQWVRRSFLEEGIFSGNDNFSKKQFKLLNVGSWSTKNYLPMCIIENAIKKQFTLIQIEHNGSWNIEIGDTCNTFYMAGFGPDDISSHWHKIISKNELFDSVPVTVSLSDSFEHVIQNITIARRNMVRSSLDGKELPVIFNDYMHALWNIQTEKEIWPLVDMAKELECEEFVIDAGWFAKGCDWADCIGDWVEYSPNFPSGGLKGTMDYIHSKGLKCGLWIEIENMGMKSPLAMRLPKEWFFILNGSVVERNTRYLLNFDNPDVYKWAMDVVTRLVNDYGLDYIKIDYNVDTSIGNEYNADSPGDGLMKHNLAFIRFLKEVMDKFPDLTVENCGSGGCRMDYAILKCCPIQSTSDQTDYRKYPYLSSAVLTACTPEQAAVWSYPVNKLINEKPTDEVVAMNMVNAMLGRIHLASFINELTIFQKELVIEGVRYYKKTREFKKTALPVYPNGISYFYDKDVVGGLIGENKIILCVWNTSGETRDVKVNLKQYNIDKIEVAYPLKLETTFSFCHGELLVHFPYPYMGRVFEIELVR